MQCIPTYVYIEINSLFLLCMLSQISTVGGFQAFFRQNKTTLPPSLIRIKGVILLIFSLVTGCLFW